MRWIGDEEAHVLRLYEAIHKYQAYVEEKGLNK